MPRIEYHDLKAEKTFQDNRNSPSNFDLNSDLNVINPDQPNPGEFSDNTERFTRDKNELRSNRPSARNL